MSFFEPDHDNTPYDRLPHPSARKSCSKSFNEGGEGCKVRICLGDCTVHSDCRDDSVCVQDPTQPLGPCVGNPQGNDVYAANGKTEKLY